MLPDSAHIQEMDIEWINRKQKKLGATPSLRLHRDDAAKSLEFFSPKKYGETFEVVKGVRARFRDAGHILWLCFHRAVGGGERPHG